MTPLKSVIMGSQYVLANNDFPEAITVELEHCRTIRIQTESTKDILLNPYQILQQILNGCKSDTSRRN